MDYLKKYEEWLEKVNDVEVNEQLRALAKDENALKNAFYKDLEFGTGGLRGFLGAGTNCLNIYTIRKVTQGVAECVRSHNGRVAAVSYDSRINSQLFARTVAEVFAKNGIKTYITKQLMPTPYLSYMTRALKADVGVMITASHNPSKYNGYKVYGADGCQLTDEGALEMTEYINEIDEFSVKTETLETYILQGKVEYVPDNITEEYLAEVYANSIKKNAKGLKVTYSPLNGTGYQLVPKILEMMQVDEISIVEEQSKPDGNFTTCPYPNPEKPDALRLGLELMKQRNSDLLIATDPDCDRVGIAVATKNGNILLSGNEVGVLLCEYLLSTLKERNELPVNPMIVKTIVTTELTRKIANEYGAEVVDVLTGFKYIGDVIGKLEQVGQQERYLLGFEESYGYLSGTYVRDKDAVNGAMLIAEMCAHYKAQGKTLVDKINEVYAKYGLYAHRLITYEFAGADGNALMKKLLVSLRENLPKEIAGSKVIRTVDYLTQTEEDLPKSNVLSFFTADGSQLIVRPSGTEPLIKMYLTACEKTAEDNEEKFRLMRAYLDKQFNVNQE